MHKMASAATTETKSEPTQEEWTFVKSKSRFRRKPPKVPAKALEAARSSEPRIFKSVEEIATEYDGFKARWRDTTCHERIKDLVKKNAGDGRRVKKAICLGVGTFDPEDGGWDAKRRSYIQLDGFLTVVEALCMYSCRCSNANQNLPSNSCHLQRDNSMLFPRTAVHTQ